jgi:hypothetical protein
MTAANLIVCDRAAYLINDTAHLSMPGSVDGDWSSDGTTIINQREVSPDKWGCVAQFCLKTAIRSTGSLPIAIARTDRGCPAASHSTTSRWLEGLSSADEGLATLPRLVDLLKDDLHACAQRYGWADGWESNRHFVLLLAMWSEERRRPEGYAVSSLPHAAMMQHYLQVVGATVLRELTGGVWQIRQHVSPPVEFSFDCNDAERDAVALLEAQRELTFNAIPEIGPIHTVGGTACVITASEHGLGIRFPEQWPDQVGRRIQPA